MDREEIRRGFCPLLGLLTSDAVEQCAARGNLSFADLLAPFCSVSCTVKDPTGTSVSTRLMLDVRDLRRDGFLLSLTVLPSVLHEAVSSVASTSDTQLAFTTFAESLLQWAEPAEHELLRTYVACIFAVSSEDEDAIGELAKLVQLQHTQQHGGASSPPIGPAHCVHPKWMLPNTLKYYVLVDDASSSNEEKTNEIFETMSTTYGAQNCHLLRLNSGESSELPDPWQSFIERKYRGLENGLILARRNLLSRSSILVDGLDGTNSVCLCSAPSANYTPRVNNCVLHPPPSHGQCWDSNSRGRISALVEKMTTNALIPFVERQLRTLNEQIAARRGISKSLTTGVRKWFISAATQPTSNSSVSYSMESSEMQMRRLADMCFLFGLYSFAHQLYQTVRKEFDFDQASLYHAGALEMAAVSAFLGNPEMKAKQYPQDYMEKSVSYYATICMRPILAVRAALISISILSALELYTEAATQLLKLTSIENDLFSGILLERASVMFGKAGMPRKMAFHYVLAGHRLGKAGQKALSLECYRRALPEYAYKNWHFAEDHILCTLAAECGADQTAMEYSSRLIRTECLQHAEQQWQFLHHLLTLLSRNLLPNSPPAVVPVPLVDGKRIRVIYGERPQEVLPELTAELNIQENGLSLTWRDLEQAAFCSLFGSSSFFKPTPLVSDASTDNSKIRSTPPNERFRMIIPIRNPLGIPLILKRLRLTIKEDPSILEQNVVEELKLEEESAWTEVEFYLRPWPQAAELHITGIAFDLVLDELSVPCQIPIELRGPRLSKSRQHSTSEEYEADHRLDASVSPESWPLLDITLSRTRHVNAFCGQIYRIECDVSNIGDVVVDSLRLATNRPELVSLSELNCESNGSQTFWEMVDCSFSSSSRNILVFSPSFKMLKAGEKKRLRVELRAPAEEVKGFSIAFIFYYRGENGMVREQRHLISMDTRRLLQTSLKLVDASVGVCLLHTRNLISTRDSVLAKIELLRIRSIVSHWGSLTDSVDKPDIFVQPVRNRVVHLECEQSDNYCFVVTARQVAACSSTLWFGDPVTDAPEWPVLPVFTDASAVPGYLSSSPISPEPELNLRFGILWKANVVNTDGTIANVFGENFVDNPYPLGYTIPECYGYTFRTTVQEQSLKGARPGEAVSEGVKESRSLLCTVTTQPTVISHDFTLKRLCEIPVRVTVTNSDQKRRSCEVTLRCVTPGESFLRPELGTADSSVLSPPAALSSPISPSGFQVSSGTGQPVMIAHRSRIRCNVAFGATHVFDVRINVACASVYDIACFEMSARFDGAVKDVPVAVPCAHVTVIDC